MPPPPCAPQVDTKNSDEHAIKLVKDYWKNNNINGTANKMKISQMLYRDGVLGDRLWMILQDAALSKPNVQPPQY